MNRGDSFEWAGETVTILAKRTNPYPLVEVQAPRGNRYTIPLWKVETEQ